MCTFLVVMFYVSDDPTGLSFISVTYWILHFLKITVFRHND